MSTPAEQIVALQDVPDPVFADALVGPGVAIDRSEVRPTWFPR